jgi:hypothetical protein
VSVFLVKDSYLHISQIDYALNDFIEQSIEELVSLSEQDYREIKKIQTDPYYIVKSYLFDKIEPFLLPFYKRTIQQVYKT